MEQCLIADLSSAQPQAHISRSPAPDKWIVLPYEAEGFAGAALLAPMRSKPPDVSVQLPDLGLCKIYVGIYGCGEAPVWLHYHYGRQRGVKFWNRLYLRLSDEDWYDYIIPHDFSDQPKYSYISESFWKTADINGKSLVLAPPRKEALEDTTACVAYIRLEPVAEKEIWPKETKRLVNYYDGTFLGHFVDSLSDVKTQIAPLADTDAELIFWNTAREDTCYYPTKVGHVLKWHGTPGLYPHWVGRDLQAMLARGEDPLACACDVAHSVGLKIYGSYRRLTCRLAPHVFPLHPEAMLITRPDLHCVDENGQSVAQLSLAFDEVRQRMIDIFSEQAENYDIDGVHMFFCRGVPFTLFEQPVLDAFKEEFGDVDPRLLPLDDGRVWAIRAKFVLKLLRALRTRLDEIGNKKGKRLGIAMTVFNRPRTCAYFGLDIEAMVRENLVDILVPFPCHYLPEQLGPWQLSPEFVAEFAEITRQTPVRIYPDCGYDYSQGKIPIEQRAADFYAAGADGLQVLQGGVRYEQGHHTQVRNDAVNRRLGHIEQLPAMADTWRKQHSRPVAVRTIAGFRINRFRGIWTCG